MKQQNEYTEQAERFLQENGIRMESRFDRHGHHFDDDKQTRDIFRVTFTRDYDNIPEEKHRLYWDNTSSKFGVWFGQSIADSTQNGDNPPTSYDVLSCLQKSSPGTLEDFCGEFGMDVDSIKAGELYERVQREWWKVSDFFTKAEIELLQEIN